MLWLLIIRPILFYEKLQVRFAVYHKRCLLYRLRTAEENRTGHLHHFRKLGHHLLDNRDLRHIVALDSLQVIEVRIRLDLINKSVDLVNLGFVLLLYDEDLLLQMDKLPIVVVVGLELGTLGHCVLKLLKFELRIEVLFFAEDHLLPFNMHSDPDLLVLVQQVRVALVVRFLELSDWGQQLSLQKI